MGCPDRLLSAAENIFAGSGYQRASMSEIAQEAGLTRQALYHHYPGKEVCFGPSLSNCTDWPTRLRPGLEDHRPRLHLAGACLAERHDIPRPGPLHSGCRPRLHEVRLTASNLRELDRMIRLLVTGAVAPATSKLRNKGDRDEQRDDQWSH